MKKAKLILAAALVSTLLFGCGDKGLRSQVFAPIENSVYVTRDGGISNAIVELYGSDKDNYTEDTLKAWAEEAVIAYNKSKGATESAYSESGSDNNLPVAIEECSLKDGTATLIFRYATAEDMIEFSAAGANLDMNIQGIRVMQLSDAAQYLEDASFIKADGADAAADDVKKQEKAFAAIVEGSTTLQVEGKVLFMSKGVVLVDRRTVSIPEQGTSIIIFK